MPQLATTYNVFITSPSDVQQERKAVEEVVSLCNAANYFSHGILFYPVPYEKHTLPIQGEPQLQINRQVEKCDMLVGIFNTRIGTETTRAISASVEEIELAIKNNIHTMVYFSEGDLPRDADLNQIQKLRDFQSKYQSIGYYETYSDIAEFKEKLRHHLELKISDIVTAAKQEDPTDFLRCRAWRNFHEFEIQLIEFQAHGMQYTLSGHYLTNLFNEIYSFSVDTQEADLNVTTIAAEACDKIEQAKTLTPVFDGGITTKKFWSNLAETGDLLLILAETVGTVPVDMEALAVTVKKDAISLAGKLQLRRNLPPRYNTVKEDMHQAFLNLLYSKSSFTRPARAISKDFLKVASLMFEAITSREALGAEAFNEFFEKCNAASRALEQLPQTILALKDEN